jgi:proliferating cell nuclear antigen
MMIIKLANYQKVDVFHQIFQHMKLFTDNINIILDSRRMFIQTMDSSHVSIVEINLPASWFDQYKVDEPITIGVNSTVLFKILSTREKSQVVTMQLENESDNLLMSFTCDDKSIFDKYFNIPLMEIDSELMDIPECDYQAEFSLPSTNFANLVNQLKMFGEMLEIECSEENIILYSKSQESATMKVNMEIDDLISFSINEGEVVKLSYSLNYLHNFCAFNKISKEVEIKLSEGYPIKIKYILDTENEDAKFTFYLAPKINDD